MAITLDEGVAELDDAPGSLANAKDIAISAYPIADAGYRPLLRVVVTRQLRVLARRTGVE